MSAQAFELFNRFLHPWFLALLPLPWMLLALAAWRERKRATAVVYSSLDIARGLPRTFRQRLLGLMPWTRALALSLGVVALARPQFGTVEFHSSAIGVDISLILDVSGSMQQEDYRPNRLEAAKAAAVEFVKGRTTDRVSVVVFATSAAILCPPTMDMNTAQMFIEAIYDGIVNNQNTAVGDGLAIGVKKLEDSPAKSRVAILLTDGESNAGDIKPLQAAEIARALKVKVYTIGVCRNLPRGATNLFGQPLNLGGGGEIGEDTLQQVAERTGGRYFRATDPTSLREIYAEIDRLEKSKIEVEQTADYDERFLYFWGPGVILLMLEFLLRAFLLRRLP